MYITYKKKYMKYIKECKINVTVGNGQNMKCDLKGSVSMKVQEGETSKLTKVLYVPQAVKNILSVSRLVLKGATMGDNQDKIIIKNNGVSINLNARKFQNKSMMFYLKAKVYAPEGQ